MRHFLLLSFVFLVTVPGAWAQQVISGKVTDEKGAPVTGANINVKASATGTITDMAGVFRLRIPSDTKVLIVSALGYAVKEVPVNNETELNITLALETENMHEIVVVAYGTARKQSLTGAVATVTAPTLDKRPLTNAIAALEGAAAGIQVNNTVGQPGSSPTVRIRGFASVNYSNDPLYVIDGVPFGGNVADINPADIESISVLKDAASSALYGSRASNGVIIMTTKKGTKSNAPSLNFTMNQGVYDKGINEYDKMNANEFMETMWKGYRNNLRSSNPGTYPNDDVAGAKATSSLISDYLKLNIYNKPDNALFDANGKLVSDAGIRPGYAEDLDWYKDYERLGQRSDYNLSGKAGSDKNSLYFSLGYLDEKGYIKYSDFKRFSGRINADLQAAKWLKYGFNIGATHQNANNTPASTSSVSSFTNPINFSRNIAPIYPVHLHDVSTGDYVLDLFGNRQYDISTVSGSYAGRHAIWENELNKDQFFRNTLMGQVYVNLNFLNQFTFGITGDMNSRNDDEQVYNNAIVGDGAGNHGRASRRNYRYRNYTVRQTLTWNKKFDAHSIDVMAGHENYNYDLNYLSADKANEAFAGAPELRNFFTIVSLSDYKDVYRTEGYFTRARYNYADKYFLDGSFRRDASSKFFTKWGNFYSIGGSWMISREPFMEMVSDKINTLKLRASYGEVGSDAGVSNYAWMHLYDINQNGNAGALFKTQNLTKGLIWETSASAGAAIEGRIFGRANFMVEYFDKQSKNLIFDMNLPLSAGATSSSTAVAVVTKNLGSVSNRGWEFTFDVDVVRTQDLRFNVGANATFMKNKVVQLPEENRENGIINGTKKIMPGHSIYDFWLPQFVGVDQMTGNALYLPDTVNYTAANPIPAQYLVNINGQNYTTYTTYAKRDWSGSAIPDVFGSFASTLSYKNVTLAGLFTYAVGGKTYDYSYAGLRSMSGTPSALHKDLLKAWDGTPKDMTTTSENRIDPNGIPVVDFFRSDKNNAQSTQFLQNGSYLVVKNVNLSYKFSKEMLRMMDLRTLSIGISVENLMTRTKLRGMNPQQSFNGTSDNAFVTPRVLSFMLNVGL